MDPNDQASPAGPDGPDKEKMQQVSRLVPLLSRHCALWMVLCVRTNGDVDSSTTSGQAGQPSCSKAGGEHAR
jgi:hypothetical protein